MATRKSSVKIVKVTINLFASDWDFIKKTYIKSGASNAARKIIAAHVRGLREKIRDRQPDTAKLEVELD